MRARIPFTYHAYVITASGGRSDKRHYRETFEFEIPETGAGDEALALRIRGYHDRTPAFLLEQGGLPREVDVLCIEGQLYEKLRSSDRSATGRVRSSSEHSDFDAFFYDFVSTDSAVKEAEAVKRKGPPRPETVDWSTRDQNLSRVQSLASRFLVVNGDLHKRMAEPMLRVRRGKIDLVSADAYEGGPGPYAVIQYSDWPHLFGLDEAEAALGRARRQGAAEVALPVFEVHDAGALRGPDPAIVLRSLARDLEGQIACLLTKASLEVMVAFDALRRGQRMNHQDVPEDELLALVEHTCGILEGRGFAPEATGHVREVLALRAARIERLGMRSDLECVAPGL